MINLNKKYTYKQGNKEREESVYDAHSQGKIAFNFSGIALRLNV